VLMYVSSNLVISLTHLDLKNNPKAELGQVTPYLSVVRLRPDFSDFEFESLKAAARYVAHLQFDKDSIAFSLFLNEQIVAVSQQFSMC
jgi:hypothetical protein